MNEDVIELLARVDARFKRLDKVAALVERPGPINFTLQQISDYIRGDLDLEDDFEFDPNALDEDDQ